MCPMLCPRDGEKIVGGVRREIIFRFAETGWMLPRKNYVLLARHFTLYILREAGQDQLTAGQGSTSHS